MLLSACLQDLDQSARLMKIDIQLGQLFQFEHYALLLVG